MNRQTESEIYGGIFTHGHKVEIFKQFSLYFWLRVVLRIGEIFHDVAVLLSVRMIFHFDKCLNSLNKLIVLRSAWEKNGSLSSGWRVLNGILSNLISFSKIFGGKICLHSHLKNILIDI